MARLYPFDYSIRGIVNNRDGQFPLSNQAKEEYLQPEIVSDSLLKLGREKMGETVTAYSVLL